MRFARAIDRFLYEQRSQGRINSPNTERDYRATLLVHDGDVDGRDPRYTNRDGVRTTLRHWSHPNTQSKHRSILVAFYGWLVEEGLRPDNPALQTKRPKRRQPQVYRMTREETARVLATARGSRERRAIYLGICAGLRRKELLGLQGRHFRAPGIVWVSEDIAKGARSRPVPVVDELEPIWQEIHEQVDLDEYVLPAQRWRDPGVNRDRRDLHRRASSEQALWRLVRAVGGRAGLPVPLKPHMLRHAFADHIARYAGMRNAQFLLGHKRIGTTEEYLGVPTADELAAAIRGFSFGDHAEIAKRAGNVDKAPTGIEPVEALSRTLERLFANDGLRELARV